MNGTVYIDVGQTVNRMTMYVICHLKNDLIKNPPAALVLIRVPLKADRFHPLRECASNQQDE